MGSYGEFVASKLAIQPPTGIDDIGVLHDDLFPHQEALTKWALRRGRCAVFADTGLGKTRIELAWASKIGAHTQQDILILAPLAVAAQTVREGELMGIRVNYARDLSELVAGINITNYERVERFAGHPFGGVVPDESSIIKHHSAKTFQILTDQFFDTPFRLCATATPAPNDWTELGTHAEFLGICTRSEMLAEYFVHDGGDTQSWQLKRHARAAFWRWVASWAAVIRSPADLGFDASAYLLPPLETIEHIVRSDAESLPGHLFAMPASTLTERRDARRASINHRVAECAAIVNADSEPWIVWCDLNDEADALLDAIPGAIEVRGPDSIEEKEKALLDFADGRVRVLITKPSIAGFGLNWQHCARVAFVGRTDSYEAYYQAVRRCWRFGQRREVKVHLFASDLEGAVVANLKRKEAAANALAEAMIAETNDAVRSEVLGSIQRSNPYEAGQRVAVPAWLQEDAA